MARLAFLSSAVILLVLLNVASPVYWNPPPPQPPSPHHHHQQFHRPQAQHYPVQNNAGPFRPHAQHYPMQNPAGLYRPQSQDIPHQIYFPQNQYSPPAQTPGNYNPPTNPNSPADNGTDFVTAVFDGRPDGGVVIDGRGRPRPRM